MGVDKPVDTYLPHEQAPRLPHGWLKIYGSAKYPHFDWVGPCLRDQILGVVKQMFLLQPKKKHNDSTSN